MIEKNHEFCSRLVSDLIPYANNSRLHSEEQVNQIASSIKEFGFTNPILIDDDDGIVAGHGRVLAAAKLKIESLPCIRLAGLTDTQKKAYVIADNKLALNADWDNELLFLELKGLNNEDFDLSLIGFDVDELSNIFDPLSSNKELKEERYSEIFNIIVECDNEQHQESIYNELDKKGYKCQVQSL